MSVNSYGRIDWLYLLVLVELVYSHFSCLTSSSRWKSMTITNNIKHQLHGKIAMVESVFKYKKSVVKKIQLFTV